MASLDQQTAPRAHNDVTKDNLVESQSKIISCIAQATFVSIDTEFTGLGRGPSQNTRASNIEERYVALREVVLNHAMVAFGLSAFKESTPESPESASLETSYTADHFNFTLLCQVCSSLCNLPSFSAFLTGFLGQNAYTVNPKSLSFLAESGFDFNKQAISGIPYFPGDIQESNRSDKFNVAMRQIFRRLLTAKVPVVVHNGLLDIMFLYHGFYACLPRRLDTFLADLSDMFPQGIYDTKYIADYLTREKASFLLYLFKKYEREQLKRKTNSRKTYVTVAHNNVIVDSPVKAPHPLNKSAAKHCQQFANHGHCPKGVRCPLSHDLDVILDAEMNKRKRRRKEEHSDEAKPDTESEESGVQAPSSNDACDPPATTQSQSQSHSAHFDAYMTGFVFARQALTYSLATLQESHVNRIYLIGKSFPLIISKSAFAGYSESHEAQRPQLI
ncbi:ribonuclease CAF1 [Basidiobolus meristosporus CBS 931.73]|uniref:Ribonuclease CAF1 n=1 Tax=Basidiobolus meristosporus CBS 931.73 TaxID=1314790 RepID=A0A1Y1YIM7_9FUNG|nr:ribonuclease CAF1 [Basidiobolus meristosporus CBS 931.73]|eukprot:ORX97829.1 ribonuclease CAF1 [Basidiobolus meristosporus CBS 931.73]